MTPRLLQVLARSWKKLWRRSVPVAAYEQENEGGHWRDARARFWSEFREGQREAEALKAASLAGPGNQKG